MSGTPAVPLLAEPPPFATALLLRLLRPGPTQTIATPPDKAPAVTLSDAMMNDPGPTVARHAPTSKVYGETRITAQSSAGGIEGWRAHLTSDPPIDRVVKHDFLNDESGREPRVGLRAVLNDVSGRTLRVFRKSPCPPRARNSYQDPPWRQPRGKAIVSLVNSHTNATSKR